MPRHVVSMDALFVTAGSMVSLHDRLVAPTEEDLEAQRSEWERPSPEAVNEALDRLALVSPVEADILDLTLKGKHQDDIRIVISPEGEIPLSQGAISYRLQRAVMRLTYLRWLDGLHLDETSIEEALLGLGWPPRTARVLADLYVTHCTTETAKRLGMGQPRVFGLQRAAKGRLVDEGGDDIVSRIARWFAGYRPNMTRECAYRPGSRMKMIAANAKKKKLSGASVEAPAPSPSARTPSLSAGHPSERSE